MIDERHARLADFATRTETDPDTVYREATIGSYIPVNPMADENEVLLRLGLSREMCTKVDCYWNYGDDIYFLQVHSSKHANREPGLWARISIGEPSYTNLVAIVEEPYVTRETVHRVMSLFTKVLARDVPLGTDLRRVD